MRTFCLGLGLILIFIVPISAQKVLLSDQISLKNAVAYYPLGIINKQYLVIVDKDTEVDLHILNEDLHEIKHVSLTLDQRRPQLLGAWRAGNDRFTILYEFKQRDTVIVKAHQYDAMANLMDSTTLYYYNPTYRMGSTEVSESEDQSHVMIFNESNKTRIIGYGFDVVQMKLDWNATFTCGGIPLKDIEYEVYIENDGRGIVAFEESNRKSRQENHLFRIQMIKPGGELIEQVHNAHDYLAYDFRLEWEESTKKLHVVGLYSNRNLARSEGFFYFILDEQLQVTDNQLFPFSDDFLLTAASRDEVSDRAIPDLGVIDILFRSDGGIVIVGEKVKVFVRNSGGLSSPMYPQVRARITSDFYFEDIFVVSINPDFTIDWESVLHKRQYSQDDYGVFSSYFLFKNPSALRVLYNENIRLNTAVNEYVISTKGNFDRNNLFHTDKEGLRLRLKDAIQIASNELLIPSENRGRLRLAILQYE